MRFMIVVKATKDSEAGKFPPEKEKMFAAMTAYQGRIVTSPADQRAGAISDPSKLGALGLAECGKLSLFKRKQSH